MIEFLTTRGVANWIEKIIIEAEKELVLISPYLKLSNDLKHRLEDASKKDIKITIIYGKNDLESSEMKFIKSLKHIELYFLKNLHAKCYYNEKQLVMSSMNMYEYSEINNREMGLLIARNTNEELYLQITKESQSFKDHSKKEFFYQEESHKMATVNSPSTSYLKQSTFAHKPQSDHIHGFCIRCYKPIKFNFKKPMCNGCYDSWSYWQNYDFIENVCHGCGKPMASSFGHPLCISCFKSN